MTGKNVLGCTVAAISMVFLAGVLDGTQAQSLDTEGKIRCTSKTARQMTSVEDICVCEVVTVKMLEYLRQRKDFAAILEGTTRACPALAAILIDVPVAAIPEAPESRGEGGENRGAGTGSGGGSTGNGGQGGGGQGGGGQGGGGQGGGGQGGGGQGDKDKGHGNDPDGYDEDNPGKSSGRQNNKTDSCGDDRDRGHGNDADRVDEDNPGCPEGPGKRS
ncbi:hypothetical protein [Ovoidimarina sediminis]|uniref:hypothetical protein n=1 Tax=Ovoidimarina sediminis TaxID=3079856 RepID=UPI002914169B|nr:hypothetical protein [Rhodophyticola sp. MJ-SS7]MDU8945515.1 hypothetical protein [Rhodophyticola sp. MJ-SS7]